MSRNKPSAAQAAGNDTNLAAASGPGSGAASGAGAEQAKAREPQKPTIGRIVIAHFTDDSRHDGELEAAAIVAKVNDDGSLNLRVFAPNGGADIAATGVRTLDEVDAMEEGADKNAAMSCTWSWPSRA